MADTRKYVTFMFTNGKKETFIEDKIMIWYECDSKYFPHGAINAPFTVINPANIVWGRRATPLEIEYYRHHEGE